MNRELLFAAVLLCGCFAVAQENGIPGWPGLPSHYLVTRVDTVFIGGFSPGGSDDWPKESVMWFDCTVRSALNQPNVLIVLQGTADVMDWEKRRRKEDHRLDVGVAESRAVTAYTRLKLLGGGATVLPPTTNYPDRGFIIYLVHYRAPRQVERITSNTQTVPGELRLGVAVGGTYLHSNGMAFAVPTASLVFKLEPATYLLVGGGLWSHTIANSSFPDRAEIMVAAELAYFPDDAWLGYALGARGAWENNLSQDKYLERAYGFTLGPRLRYGHVQLGVDAQLSNVDRAVGTSTWGVGVAVTARFVYLPW